MISFYWGCFSWFFWMVVDYGCSKFLRWDLVKPWMLYYVNGIYAWNIVILYGVCHNPIILGCSSLVSTTWLYHRPVHKSSWWMVISQGTRGSRLPLQLVLGWKTKYVVRNRILDSQNNTWDIMECTSIVYLWPHLRGGLSYWDLAWQFRRLGGTWSRWF